MTHDASHLNKLMELLWEQPDARRAIYEIGADKLDKADALRTILHWATVIDVDICKGYADEAAIARGAVYDMKEKLRKQIAALQSSIDDM